MPRKRRIEKRRLDVLSVAQESHLCCGDYILPFGDEFEDEAHRAAAWRMHRHVILGDWDRPGTRPAALWDYDLGDWSEFGASEAEAVYRLLQRGELEPCQLNGRVVIASELAQIEEDWLREIRLELSRRTDRPLTIETPLLSYGTPPQFYRQHAPGIVAELEGERIASQRR